jgi:uncharacterized protein
MIRTLAILALVMTMQAFGQTGPSFDCARAESTAEKLVCEDAELARLDRRIAERYAAALAAARNPDSEAAETESRIRATQRGWIIGRDECWKASDTAECVRSSYLRREGQLVALWMLEEPTSIAFWSCNDSPANEIVTYFFATELPSVRIERLDRVDTGSLVPTASGSKYQGSFGRSIWIKGEEATYREADPDGSSYTCTVRQRR